jgi:hypothetical protein
MNIIRDKARRLDLATCGNHQEYNEKCPSCAAKMHLIAVVLTEVNEYLDGFHVYAKEKGGQ